MTVVKALRAQTRTGPRLVEVEDEFANGHLVLHRAIGAPELATLSHHTGLCVYTGEERVVRRLADLLCQFKFSWATHPDSWPTARRRKLKAMLDEFKANNQPRETDVAQETPR